MTDTQPADDTPERTREQRLAELAEKLCRSYTYGVGLEELQKTDPEDAGAHRDAAEHLLPWIDEAPKREIREAFGRGYDKGRDRGRASQAREMEQLRADLDRVQQKACSTAEALRLNSQRLEQVLADRENERAVRTAEEKRARIAEARVTELEQLHQAHLRVEQRLAREQLAAEAAIERVKELAGSWRLGHYEGDLGPGWNSAAIALLAVLKNPEASHREIGFDSPATTGRAALDQPQQPTTTEA